MQQAFLYLLQLATSELIFILQAMYRFILIHYVISYNTIILIKFNGSYCVFLKYLTFPLVASVFLKLQVHVFDCKK